MTQVQAADERDELRSGIVDAATHLLREKGARAVTTRAVGEAAGVQPPTIYRLFGDKDGLIDAVAENVMATYVAAKSVSAAAADGGSPMADLRAGWDMHVDFGVANPELYALLNTRARSEPSAALAAGIEVLRTRVRRLAAAGLLRVDEQRAVLMIHAAGNGTVLALLGRGADERDLSLSDAMFDAVMGSILSSVPATADTGMSTVAVLLRTMVADLPALSGAERTLMTEWLTRSIVALQA